HRNPPYAPAASEALPVPKSKRHIRSRQKRLAQTDLEEFIAADKAAEAAAMAAGAPCASTVETPPPGERAAPSTGEQPDQEEAKVEGDIKYLKEAVRIRPQETSQPAYDYRFLLRPIQEM